MKISKTTRFLGGFSVFMAIAAGGSPAQQNPLSRWSFGEGSGRIARDSIGDRQDAIRNNFRWGRADRGGGLKFDGFTTFIERAPADAPKVQAAFSVVTWIALQSYPWNWVAVADHHQEVDGVPTGYFFGVNAEGKTGLRVRVGTEWLECSSAQSLPLFRWTQVAAVFDPAEGIRLYIDGQPAGNRDTTGALVDAPTAPFRIGRNLKDLPATALVRQKAQFPALYSLDGLLRGLAIYPDALSSQTIRRNFDPNLARLKPDLRPRHWPDIPFHPQYLSAAYTELKLYPEWDATWRSGPYADVVVGFPGLPISYVFWRGANFGPSLVTENGIWFGEQSFEASTKIGTAEHMNDKHDLYSHISIEENSSARVVLHWRYALADVLGNFAGVDALTGWGDSADEYFYIYPDGTAVRHGTVHGVRAKYSFTEPTLLLQPGQKPEDLLSLDAVTIGNPDGETRTYSWQPASPPYPFPDQPSGTNFVIVNSKSQYRPFYIYRPGTILGPYGWPPEIRPSYSHFPVWDHWPVNLLPSDGRFALYPDHFASAAILSPNLKGTWTEGPTSKSASFLFGLGTRTPAELAMLDRSWQHAPTLSFRDASESATYDPDQGAYKIVLTQSDAARSGLSFRVNATRNSPAVDPAFVIDGWKAESASVELDGGRLPAGRIQIGIVPTLEGNRLVVWLRRTATTPFSIDIHLR
jgi:Concanavalin A-like lectin/glucanases superfamily